MTSSISNKNASQVFNTKPVLATFASATSPFPVFARSSIVLNPDGSIREVDQTLLDKNGVTLEIDKLLVPSGSSEVDHFSNGKLANVQAYNWLGELTNTYSYGQDGKTITETDTYKYGPASFSPVAETKSDRAGKVFETDTFSYGKYGFLSQVSKADANGKLFEVDQYDSFGNLVSVTHPNTTAPVVTTPEKPVVAPVVTNPVTLPTPTVTTPAPVSTPVAPPATSPSTGPSWSKVGGFGEIDVLKAISTVLGKALPDVAIPSSIQSQWDLGSLHFQDAWAAGYAGKGVVVADIDTGIDLKNPDLTKNLSQYNWNFINNSSNVQDDNGHGTCTASEICAANDGKGITGGAYDAQLMVLKALDAKGSGADTNIASAINYAVDHGANVINLSLGATIPDSTLLAALKSAANHGVIVCMAAGNDGNSTPAYPAAYAQNLADCIAVGATKPSNGGFSMAYFSDHAGSSTPYNFVDAPGQSILGYGLDGTLRSWSGTSMAAPLVAAEAADILSAHPSLSADQVVQDIVHATVALVGVTAG